jgi:membrane-associated phospholipid phosphatase
MEWLQVLDAGIFRFINQSLSNPVFDHLMPWLSGDVLLILAALVAAGGIIWRYHLKGVLCILMLALVVPAGDGLVCKTIKQAVQRPRPYVTIAETTKRVPRTSPYASMPSSHAANWFCATMIAWLFVRRSARFMLPIAAAVSLSRVYNGVHYPGDVLAGATFGAGYGFVGVFLIDKLWQCGAKKLFPVWYERVPSLVHAGRVPLAGQATPDSHWLRAGYLLIVFLTLARWTFQASGSMQLSEDEAYQWHWSKHLALSYYSKPPLIAYAQFLGTSLWGDNELGVRFLSPLIAAILGVMLLRFFAREVSARVGFALLLMITATPLLAVGATLMTVDPLSVLFWTAAMLAGWQAIKPDSGVSDWLWVGLWMGLGFLSKYTELFQLLCWAVFFVLWKPARIQLRRPGPWLAILVNAVCALPVIIWNSQNHWITARHVAGNANLNKSWQFSSEHLQDLGEFIGAELFLLNPIFFVGTVWAAVAFWRKYHDDARMVYFFSMGASVFLIYLGWTFHSAVFPNWIAPSVLPLFCLMMIYWERERLAGVRFFQPWYVAGVAFGLTAVIFLHDTEMFAKLSSKPLPVKMDPGNRVRNWHEVGRAVGEAREKLAAEGKPVFIIGDHYGITSLISFYLPESRKAVSAGATPFVYFLSSDTPLNQFYFWPGYRDRPDSRGHDRKHENAIFVNRKSSPPPESLTNEFESVTALPPVDIRHREQVVHKLYLYECRNLR